MELTPTFPSALFAIPIIIATMVIALRTNPPKQHYPLAIIACLAIGFIGLASSYPLFANFGAPWAMTAVLLGCFSFHLALWLARNGGDEVETTEQLPPALDPDLLDFDDIDWNGFDRARTNWSKPQPKIFS